MFTFKGGQHICLSTHNFHPVNLLMLYTLLILFILLILHTPIILLIISPILLLIPIFLELINLVFYVKFNLILFVFILCWLVGFGLFEGFVRLWGIGFHVLLLWAGFVWRVWGFWVQVGFGALFLFWAC